MDSWASGGHFYISHLGVTFPLAKVIHRILFWRFSVFWEKGLPLGFEPLTSRRPPRARIQSEFNVHIVKSYWEYVIYWAIQVDDLAVIWWDLEHELHESKLVILLRKAILSLCTKVVVKIMIICDMQGDMYIWPLWIQDAPVYCAGFVTGSWSLTSAILLPCVLSDLLALRSYWGCFTLLGEFYTGNQR